jgi:hypothetical protein
MAPAFPPLMPPECLRSQRGFAADEVRPDLPKPRTLNLCQRQGTPPPAA